MRLVTRPWQMYLVGLLFGLGFDTASEVALLVVAGGAAMAAVPWYAILALPLVFAAGMSLLDTLDGWFMSLAYGWAFTHPRRRLLYNSALTALSAGVALSIGAIELASLSTAGRGTGVDFGALGYAVVGLFIVVWFTAVIISRSTGQATPALSDAARRPRAVRPDSAPRPRLHGRSR
jgi:high-affinity nickel-transport protein